MDDDDDYSHLGQNKGHIIDNECGDYDEDAKVLGAALDSFRYVLNVLNRLKISVCNNTVFPFLPSSYSLPACAAMNQSQVSLTVHLKGRTKSLR